MCLCMYLPDSNLAEVETCGRIESDYYLLLVVQFIESTTV